MFSFLCITNILWVEKLLYKFCFTFLQGKLASQGQLLFHGPLVCCEKTSSGASFKGKDLQVFLFEQILIFSEAEGKKTQYTSPRYKYKNHIQVCNYSNY